MTSVFLVVDRIREEYPMRRWESLGLWKARTWQMALAEVGLNIDMREKHFLEEHERTNRLRGDTANGRREKYGRFANHWRNA